MKQLLALIKRNVKLYFKDKGTFFTSLITPVILLVLYGTFLKNVYEESFRSALKAAGAAVSDAVINGCVGGQLIASLLAVSCVTVSFCSNLLMVQDKISGARRDLTIAPIRPATLSLGYYFSTLISSLLICLAAAGICFGYLAKIGWFLSFGDVMQILGDVVLLVLFGTALSSIIIFPLKTQGQASSVGTIVSAGYGFICGAYMPISSFSQGLQKFISFLPGTYGTSLLRNHALRGVLDEMRGIGFPQTVIEDIRDSIDCNLYFFDSQVHPKEMYAILIGTTVIFIALYIFLNWLSSRKKRIKL